MLVANLQVRKLTVLLTVGSRILFEGFYLPTC